MVRKSLFIMILTVTFCFFNAIAAFASFGYGDDGQEVMNKQLPPNRSSRSATIRKLLRVAYKMKGVPYVFGGMSPYGFDCSGFIKYTFAHAGVSVPRSSYHQYRYGQPVKLNDLRVGDLVFFSTSGPGASHCGIYVGNGKFIHAGSSTGITVAKVLNSYWGPRYYGACRVF